MYEATKNYIKIVGLFNETYKIQLETTEEQRVLNQKRADDFATIVAELDKNLTDKDVEIANLKAALKDCDIRFEAYNEYETAIAKLNVRIKELEEEVDGLEHILREIEKTCDDAGISNMDTFDVVTDKVEHLKQLYVLYLGTQKWGEAQAMKASKHNTDKLLLLSIVNNHPNMKCKEAAELYKKERLRK